MSSLDEEFPKEQARVRELILEYSDIPTGGFAATRLEAVLKRADAAAISGDLTAMIRSFEEMKECQ